MVTVHEANVAGNVTDASDALGRGVVRGTHRAAAAAVELAGLQVHLATVGRVVVAVRVPGDADDLTNPEYAGGFAILARAGRATDIAIEDVSCEIRLAPIQCNAIALSEPRVAHEAAAATDAKRRAILIGARGATDATVLDVAVEAHLAAVGHVLIAVVVAGLAGATALAIGTGGRDVIRGTSLAANAAILGIACDRDAFSTAFRFSRRALAVAATANLVRRALHVACAAVVRIIVEAHLAAVGALVAVAVVVTLLAGAGAGSGSAVRREVFLRARLAAPTAVVRIISEIYLAAVHRVAVAVAVAGGAGDVTRADHARRRAVVVRADVVASAAVLHVALRVGAAGAAGHSASGAPQPQVGIAARELLRVAAANHRHQTENQTTRVAQQVRHFRASFFLVRG